MSNRHLRPHAWPFRPHRPPCPFRPPRWPVCPRHLPHNPHCPHRPSHRPLSRERQRASRRHHHLSQGRRRLPVHNPSGEGFTADENENGKNENKGKRKENKKIGNEEELGGKGEMISEFVEMLRWGDAVTPVHLGVQIVYVRVNIFNVTLRTSSQSMVCAGVTASLQRTQHFNKPTHHISPFPPNSSSFPIFLFLLLFPFFIFPILLFIRCKAFPRVL